MADPVELQPTTPVTFVDPETGLTATRHDGGVWFRNGNNYFSAPSVAAGIEHDPNASLATPDEVTARLEQRAQDNFAGKAKIFGKQLGTHAFDVATGIVRYPAMAVAALTDNKTALQLVQDTGGEQMLENTYGIFKELTGGGNQEAAGKAYRRATRAQLAANPLAGEAGGIIGDVAPALATGGLSAAVKGTGGLASERIAQAALGRFGEGALAKAGQAAFANAIQGVGYGEQAASEAAYLNDEPLTRQKIWAGGAMGGLLGGAIGGGASLLGSGARATAGKLRPKLSSVSGPVDVAPPSSLAEALGDSKVTPQAAQEVADRAMASEGVPAAPNLAEKLHSLLTDVQAGATGTEKEAVKNYGLGAVLDPKSRVKALDGYRIFRQRPEIIEGASSEIADSMRVLQDNAENGVFQQVRDLGMKRNAWEKLVDPAKRGEQIDSARSWLADMRGKLENMLPSKNARPDIPELPDGTGFEAAASAADGVAEKSGTKPELQRFLNQNRRAVSEAERAGGGGETSNAVTEFLHDAQAKGATYNGPVYRGTTEAELASIRDSGRAGHTLSVSTDIDGAQSFAKKAGDRGVILEIKDHPVPVDGIEGSNTFSEALVPKDSPARIVGERVENGQRIVTIQMGPEAQAADSLVEPTLFGETKRIKSLLGHVKKAESLLAGDISGADAAIELDGLKRSLGKLAKGTVKRVQALEQAGDFEADAVRNTARMMSDSYEGLRQHLMNEGLWGKAGAAQKEINAGWQDWLDSRSMYSGTLMRRTGAEGAGEFGMWDTRPRFEVDPNKVGSWIDQFGTGRGKLNDQYVRAHIDATDKLTKAIGKYVDTGASAEQVAKVRSAVQKIQQQLSVARETVEVANQVQLVGGAQLSNATKLALAASGMAAGGPIGGAAGAALGFLLNPGKVMHAAMTIEGLAAKVDAEKRTAIGSFINKAYHSAKRGAEIANATGQDTAYTEAMNASGSLDSGSTLGKAAKKLATSAAVRLFGGGSAEGQAAAYQKRRDQLALLTSSPELLNHQITSTLGPLPRIAPSLAASLALDASRNLHMLQAMAPPATPIGGLFGGKRQTFTPQQDIEKFAQQWEGVMNPMSVLADLQNGTLSMAKVDAARAAHPELFADIASELVTQAAQRDEPMSSQAALQADLLLGLNGAGEPSVSPGFLARVASLSQLVQQEAQARPSPRPPANIAKGKATLSQSLSVEGA